MPDAPAAVVLSVDDALAGIVESKGRLVQVAPRVRPTRAERIVPGRLEASGRWIYATSGRELVAYRCRLRRRDRLRCRERWVQTLASRATAPPSLEAGRVLVPSWDTFVYAFRPDNGHLLWRSTIRHRIAKPLLLWNDYAAAVAEGRSLIYFLRIRDGSRVGRIDAGVEAESEVVTATPARSGDVLIAPVLSPPADEPVLKAWRVTIEGGERPPAGADAADAKSGADAPQGDDEP
jgi:hypothetical protein